MTVEIREARVDDAEQLIPLIELLPHHVTAENVRRRLERIPVHDFPQLVAVEDGKVIGLCGLHCMNAIHREQPVGRITILVVTEEYRGTGVGRRLVEEAEKRCREAGCGMIELTSNDWLFEAHRFYQRIGFEQTSKRFAKQL